MMTRTLTHSVVVVSIFLLSCISHAASETSWALNLQPCECQLVKGGLDDPLSTAPLIHYLSCIGGLDESAILTALGESGSPLSGRAGRGNAETTVPLLDGSKEDIGRVGLYLYSTGKGLLQDQALMARMREAGHSSADVRRADMFAQRASMAATLTTRSLRFNVTSSVLEWSQGLVQPLPATQFSALESWLLDLSASLQSGQGGPETSAYNVTVAMMIWANNATTTASFERIYQSKLRPILLHRVLDAFPDSILERWIATKIAEVASSDDCSDDEKALFRMILVYMPHGPATQTVVRKLLFQDPGHFYPYIPVLAEALCIQSGERDVITEAEALRRRLETAADHLRLSTSTVRK
ncbi:MAG: hypothetical protein N2111_00980 [Candidatus Sumerlaeaceae bacterium]|nr:hypothetical protein [Candidatus Sumerlaeaceae bacterium]